MVGRIICSILSIVTLSAMAATVSKTLTYDVKESELGSFRLEISHRGEPVSMPLRLKVKLECVDHRSDKKSKTSFPGRVELTRAGGEIICKYNSYTFDSATKELSIEYMVSKYDETISTCETKAVQTYNLAELCSEFSR